MMRRTGAARFFGGHNRSGERDLSAALAISLNGTCHCLSIAANV